MLALSIVALALSLSFGGCTKSTRSAELTIAVNNGVEGTALKEAAGRYETASGVKITVAELPYANLFEKELIVLASGTGAYDLIMLDDPWFPRFTAVAPYLTDLGVLYERRGLNGPDPDFVGSSLALCRHPYESGKLYALPYVGNSQLFFYREDLYKKYNLPPPARWEDVLVAARTITEQEKIYGYVMRAAQGNPVVADFLPLFWAFGGEMFDQQGKCTVNSPEGIAALRFMLELGKYSPPGYASFNADEVSAHLLQGTAAQSINWPAWISAFGDSTRSKVVGNVKIATLPGQKRAGQAEIGNWLIGIPSSSRHVEAAFEFLLWATSAEQMRKSAERGNPPTRSGLYEDVNLRSRYPSYPAQLESLAGARPRPRTHLWNEIENAFGIFLSKANSGEMSPDEAMKQAGEEIDRIVSRAGPAH